jgi:hypothetical protein
MKKYLPYWYKLISYWVIVKGRNGLTIPFILGSKQYAHENNLLEENSVLGLLTEIINSDLDSTFILLYCDNIGEYVLGIKNQRSQINGLEIKSKAQNKITLLATLSTQILGTNINDITNSLTTNYSDCLKNKRYSFINSKWTEFSDADIKMIKEALEN